LFTNFVDILATAAAFFGTILAANGNACEEGKRVVDTVYQSINQSINQRNLYSASYTVLNGSA